MHHCYWYNASLTYYKIWSHAQEYLLHIPPPPSPFLSPTSFMSSFFPEWVAYAFSVQSHTTHTYLLEVMCHEVETHEVCRYTNSGRTLYSLPLVACKQVLSSFECCTAVFTCCYCSVLLGVIWLGNMLVGHKLRTEGTPKEALTRFMGLMIALVTIPPLFMSLRTSRQRIEAKNISRSLNLVL